MKKKLSIFICITLVITFMSGCASDEARINTETMKGKVADIREFVEGEYEGISDVSVEKAGMQINVKITVDDVKDVKDMISSIYPTLSKHLKDYGYNFAYIEIKDKNKEETKKALYDFMNESDLPYGYESLF